METKPCRRIRHTKGTRYAQCTVAVLLQADVPHDPEPGEKWRVGALEHGVREERITSSALSAFEQVLLCQPESSLSATEWARIAVRPANLNQVVDAILFGNKLHLKFFRCLRVYVHATTILHIVVHESWYAQLYTPIFFFLAKTIRLSLFLIIFREDTMIMQDSLYLLAFSAKSK